MHDIDSISRRIVLAPNGATHYHAQLEHPYKGHVITGSVVCYVVWLGSMKGDSF